MGHIEETIVSGVQCDKKECTAEIKGEPMSFFKGRRHYEAMAKERGWTTWVGRSWRIYCPEHKPSRNSTMRPI